GASRAQGCRSSLPRVVCFFFQAEDGIRDRNVTGVQTCALPIFGGPALCYSARRGAAPILEGMSMPLYLEVGTPAEYEDDFLRSLDDIRGGRVSEKESKLPPGVTLTPEGGLTGTPTDLSDAPYSIGYVDAYNNKIATLSILEGEPTVPPIAV